MTEQKKNYTATDSTYRKFLAEILTVEDEKKELNLQRKEIIERAEKEGCNPKILRQKVRIVKMCPADQDALRDALGLA